MTQSDARKKWREFCKRAEEKHGPGWRDKVVPTVDGVGYRLGDSWMEFGLMEDPDAPPTGLVDRGLWQINDKPWRPIGGSE